MFSLIDSVIRVMNRRYRSQPPNMCLQCDPGLALPASQDAACNSTRKAQQNGFHVSVREVVGFKGLTSLVEETFLSQGLLHLS
jgi:hypothetical protein